MGIGLGAVWANIEWGSKTAAAANQPLKESQRE
jgi:hypothetical protein